MDTCKGLLPPPPTGGRAGLLKGRCPPPVARRNKPKYNQEYESFCRWFRFS